MKAVLICLTLLFISIAIYAQNGIPVRGIVSDTAGSPLRDVYITIRSGSDSLTTVSDAKGVFNFSNIGYKHIRLSAMMVGTENFSNTYSIQPGEKELNVGTIQLRYKRNELGEIVITANPVTIKEDTIEYRANAYKVRDGAPVEDIIKKLPGVTVDKDGNVTAQGKQVQRVRVNGKDYFGGDVQTATQNLPANIIENIQIIDDYGDRANLTGIKEGEPEKVLNINVQKGKRKGSFGNGTVAAGTESRYLARISANNFKEERQLSFLGALNNTNANLFNFNGGGKGGGARGANLGNADRSGTTDGLTLSKSLGLNYRDMWSKDITVYGSYSYSARNNTTTGTSFRQDFNPLNTSSTSGSNTSTSGGNNHRITFNIEYKIDSADYLKLTPYYSYASSHSDYTGLSQTSKAGYFTGNSNSSNTAAHSPASGTSLFFNHKFKKQGRNFSLNLSIDNSSRIQDRSSRNSYHNIDSSGLVPIVSDTMQNQQVSYNNNNTTSNVRISYDEPVGKNIALDFSYAWNESSNKSFRDVDDVNSFTGLKTKNMLQSNAYKYAFITNRYGINLHSFTTKYNYLIGVLVQPSDLNGNDLARNIHTHVYDLNYAPTARFVYNFARSHSLSFTYGGSSSEPSFTQLQPVTDSSNIKSIVIGNPDLKAQFTNRFSLQYNKVGLVTGTIFFSNLSFDQVQNKIVNSVVNDPRGTGRTISYLNANGFNSLAANISWSKPFANKKLTATVSTSANYDNNLSYTDFQENKGQNWTLRPGARLRLDIPDIVDLDLNGSWSINKTVTKYTAYTSSTEARTTTIGLDGKNYFLKNLTFGYDLTKIINSGYFSSVNSNPTLLNLFLELRFLKGNIGTLRLQEYDIFNQNTGISRSVNGTTVTDVQNNRLGRYFLLSFNLRLQKFAGKSFNRIPGQGRRNNDDGNGIPGGGRQGGRRNF